MHPCELCFGHSRPGRSGLGPGRPGPARLMPFRSGAFHWMLSGCFISPWQNKKQEQELLSRDPGRARAPGPPARGGRQFAGGMWVGSRCGGQSRTVSEAEAGAR